MEKAKSAMGQEGAKHEPKSKKAKLAELLQFKSKLPDHSQSALAAILQEAKQVGLPELHSSNHQKEARQELLQQCHGGALGPLVQQATLYKDDGATTPLHFCHLLVCIMALFHQSGSFTQLVHQAHRRQPSALSCPWNLAIYCDEIIPGNVLGRAQRKVWCIYCTILEFTDHIAQEDAWLTICVERSSFVASLDGGIAQIMGIVLESIFHNPILDPRLGLQLKSVMGDITMFFQWSMLLADGAAQKVVWSSKGDAGTKFCLLCSNVTGTPIEDHEEGDLHCTTTSYQQLQLVTSQELLDSYQRLHGRLATCSKKDFAKWQQATGLTYTKYALMLNDNLLAKHLLAPTQQFAHDWMHGILQGTGPVVIHHTLATIAALPFDVFPFLETYVQCWTCPKSWKALHLHQLFQKKQEDKAKKANKFSCIASDCLALFPILRHFLETVIQPQGFCPEAIEAFLAMALVIDQCHAGAQWKATTRSSLLAAMEAANQNFLRAWPSASMIRKWHWHLHLPDLYQRFGMLPSCFTAERKHKTISQFATRLQKTQNFESHLLEQVLANEITTLKEPDLFPERVHLCKPKKASSKQLAALAPFVSQPSPATQCSSLAKLARGGQIHAGDAIIFLDGMGSSSWKLAKVVLHARIFDLPATLVQLWDILSLGKHHAKCRDNGSTGLIPMENILFAVPYSQEGLEATMLLPYPIYSKFEQ